MHAVEDYIMSRYQMYWQVYFHPVARSAEDIVPKIFHRVKYLFENNYACKEEPHLFQNIFTKNIAVEDYLALDESVVYYYFQRWQYEDDPLLQDLAERFINRRLFKYKEYDAESHLDIVSELKKLFVKAEIDPDYYLIIDSSKDLPYDVYRSGVAGRIPIFLQMPNNKLKELSEHSTIVNSKT